MTGFLSATSFLLTAMKTWMPGTSPGMTNEGTKIEIIRYSDATTGTCR
jgi:hypothetical protein